MERGRRRSGKGKDADEKWEAGGGGGDRCKAEEEKKGCREGRRWVRVVGRGRGVLIGVVLRGGRRGGG